MPMSEIQETLFEQLGGNRFVVMTGARILTDGKDTLVIKLPKPSKIAGMSIAYDAGMDSYTITPVVGFGLNQKMGLEILDVQVGELRETFTRLTGLYTTL